MLMPAPEKEILAQRSTLIDELRKIIPGEGVIVDETSLRAYECDGLTAYRQLPMVAALSETTAHVSAVLKFCDLIHATVVPRGPATSPSGGAPAPADGARLGPGRCNHVLTLARDNRSSE